MGKYTYKEIVEIAEEITNNVKTKQKTVRSHKWVYYICKGILNPGKDVEKIKIDNAPKPSKTHISRQMSESQYKSLAKKMVEHIEKKHCLPNYLRWGDYKISEQLYTYTFSRVLVYYAEHGKWDDKITVNQKVFTKPTEKPNDVYTYTCKKFGKKFKTLDELLTFVLKYFSYQGYFDDKKSNKQVTDSKSGNCVDLLQWAINNAEAMGYEWKCIHVKCRISGTGHVFGKFKKKGSSTWFTRDIAAVADGEPVDSVWCNDGQVLATNPSWFLENLRR